MKTTATSTIHYVFDGLSVVAELDATGTVTKAYNPGISYTDDQGSTFYYMYDGLGSVVNLVDEDQNIMQAYSYDAFGYSPRDFNPYRFVGAYGVYSDDDVELKYMWNRWYDPSIGRFISRDPVGFLGGTNLYSYTANNPVNYIDYYGLDPCKNILSQPPSGYVIPEGVYLPNNLLTGELIGVTGTTIPMFLILFSENGPYDYAANLPDDDPLHAFGNFNYGAMSRAAGLAKTNSQYAAGIKRQTSRLRNHPDIRGSVGFGNRGSKWPIAPYGDFPAAYGDIAAGYDWADKYIDCAKKQMLNP